MDDMRDSKNLATSSAYFFPIGSFLPVFASTTSVHVNFAIRLFGTTNER